MTRKSSTKNIFFVYEVKYLNNKFFFKVYFSIELYEFKFIRLVIHI